ncbi:hypothetical protein [Vibrio harveyi]|uniref:hypothetical protein n=1 Tax=Vibrio harveyi TaxID=669 RepID=UPI0030B8F650
MERLSNRADFQRANQLLKQINPTTHQPELDFHQLENLEAQTPKPSQKYTNISLKIADLVTFPSLATNALLRCEQRNTEAAAYHLNH